MNKLSIHRSLAWMVAALAATGCTPSATDPSTETSEVVNIRIEEVPLTTSSDTARQLFNEGQYLLDVGRGGKAREKFRAALAEDPHFVRAHLNQANSALSIPEFQQCLDKASENLAHANDGERQMVEITRTFLTNDPARGVELARQLAEAYPTSPRARLVLGAMLAAQNDNISARAAYQAALELEPDAPAALFGLANNYLFGEPKDFAKAETWAERAIAAYPDEAKGHEVLGDVKRAQDDLENALAAYNQATETDPTLEVAQHKKGHVSSFLGRIDEARAAYDAAISAAPPETKAGYAVFRGFTHIHGGDIAAALDELEELANNIEAMGTPADQVKGLQVFALTSAANAALHAGLIDRAKTFVARRNELQMQIAEEVGTEDTRRLQEANCHLWSGLVAAYQGDSQGAAEHAAKITALVENDENPRKMEPVHWILGMSALHADDHLKAVEHLRQANHVNDMFIRYQLAVAEDGVGNAEAARKMFSEVASFNFNSVGFALVGRDARARTGRS